MNLASRLMGIAALAALALLAGCGQDESSRDDLRPSPPRWIARSADNVYPQQGIRAEAGSESDHAVRVEWYANPEPDVYGYRIWRVAEWTSPDRHYVVQDLRIGPDLEPGLDRYAWIDRGDTTNGAPLNMLAPNPETGETRGYFWEIQAYDSAGNVSDFSERAYYRLLNNPFGMIVGRDSTDIYQVSWHYAPNPDVMVNYYMLRVFSADAGPDSAVWYGVTQQYGSDALVIMDFTSADHPLVYGAGYNVQLNVISMRPTPEHADSTCGAAVYTTFTYQH